MVTLNIELTSEQVTYIREAIKGDYTAAEAKTELEKVCKEAVDAKAWEWKVAALIEENMVERSAAQSMHKTFFPEPLTND